jgi:hypothetical protein
MYKHCLTALALVHLCNDCLNNHVCSYTLHTHMYTPSVHTLHIHVHTRS